MTTEIYCCLDWILESRGISVAEFAKQAGLAYTTVNRIVRRETTGIDFKALALICDALNLTPGDLLRRKPDPQNPGVSGEKLQQIFAKSQFEKMDEWQKSYEEQTRRNVAELIARLTGDFQKQQETAAKIYAEQVVIEFKRVISGLFEIAATSVIGDEEDADEPDESFVAYFPPPDFGIEPGQESDHE